MNNINAVPTSHPKRFGSRASATAPAGRVACERTCAVQVDDLHDGPRGTGCRTAEWRMAQVHVGRGAAPTSRHRRDANAETSSCRIGGYSAHRLDSAAVSAARDDMQVMGSCWQKPALASAEELCRCAVVSGTNSEERLLWCSRAVAVERSRGVLETIEPGGAKHRYLAVADAATVKRC